MQIQEHYRVGEVRKLFGWSHRVICELFDSGELSGYRFGKGRKERRISHASIVAYVAANPEFGFAMNRFITANGAAIQS